MGVVYRARDLRLERDVALKVLPAGVFSDPDARQRFRNEALALARLNHPNICSVFDFDSENQIDFLVMEFVPGISLDQKLVSGALPSDAITQLGSQLASGLAAAHEQGVLHRDLKPGNLRLTTDWRLKILDFGLARRFHTEASTDSTITLANANEFSGTVPYMAPEQIRGQAADVRTDIYSAGAVLFEMATGRRLHAEHQLAKLVDDILNRPPPPIQTDGRSIPQALQLVIQKAIERRPEQRYQSARDLQADLERTSASQMPIVARRRPTVPRPLAAVLAVLLLLGVAAGWYFSNAKAPKLNKAASVRHANTPNSRRSVAVLGFKNVSGRPNDSWLSTALSEMLTTELGGGERLRTVAGETVARMKTDLALSDADSYAGDTLHRIRDQMASDVVVVGSYIVVPADSGPQIRLDVKLQDTASGEILTAVKATGQEADLFDMVSRAGNELRRSLGVSALSEDDSSRIRTEASSTPEATRLYAEGLAKLRVFDAVTARNLLEQAVAADPTRALAHLALSMAWGQLGYDARASESAKKAFDLSSGLPREDRMLIEARYHESAREFKKAIDSYRALTNAFPDVLDYRLRLAMVQSNGGKSHDADVTLEEARAAFPVAKDDPSFDSTEASIADHAGDFKREQAAAASAAEKASKRGERLTRARALLLEGWALQNLGKLEQAAAVSEEAKSIYESVGDRAGISRAVHNLGTIAVASGKLNEAEQQFESAAAIRRSIQDNFGLGRAINNLALIRELKGDLDGALPLYLESLSIARKIDDKSSIGNALANIGSVYRSQGRIGDAKKSFEEALAVHRSIGDKMGIGEGLTSLGQMDLDGGDNASAADFLGEASRTFEEIGFESGLAQVRYASARLSYNQGDVVSARKNYQQAFDLSKAAGDSATEAAVKIDLSVLDQKNGDFAAARTGSEQALTFAHDSGDATLIAASSRNLVVLSLAQGDLHGAEKLLEPLLAEARKSGNKERLAAALEVQGDLHAARGDLDGASEDYKEALGLYRKLAVAQDAATVNLKLARVQLEQRRWGDAAGAARKVIADARKRSNPVIEAEATVLLARISREQHRIPEARKVIDTATRLLTPASAVDLLLELAVETAQLQAASGSAADAKKALGNAFSSLGPKASFASQLDARFALAEIESKSGDNSAAEGHLNSLGNDASAKGFLMAAQKAVTLRGLESAK